MTTSVRYIVEDATLAAAFYEKLGFTVQMNPGPGFAMLSRGDLELLLNSPGTGGAGSAPTPGGWNRFQLLVDDLAAEVARLSADGVRLRTAIIDGNAGRQVVAEDPSGNAVELFEPRRPT
jgi:catechol 2,3-dioxygenase-like lactoylglutathione lyase family enzyme